MDRTSRNIVYGIGILAALSVVIFGIFILLGVVDMTRRTCIVSASSQILHKLNEKNSQFDISERELTTDEIAALLGADIRNQDCCNLFNNHSEFHFAITEIAAGGKIKALKPGATVGTV